jgi:hypothetical protein
MPTVHLSSFVPTSKISNGKAGLIALSKAPSTANITGTGLVDKLTVTVLDPPNSGTKYTWEGKTSKASADGKACIATVWLKTGTTAAPGLPTDSTDDVSVTVGDSTPLSPVSTNVGGEPILGTTGEFTVKCGASGTNVWLAGKSDGTVELQNPSGDPQKWTFNLLTGNQPNCYTVQANHVTHKYLKWSTTSPEVSLTATSSADTIWQLKSGTSGEINVMANSAPQQYLDGDPTSQQVDLNPSVDPNNGTSWAITAVQPATLT